MPKFFHFRYGVTQVSTIQPIHYDIAIEPNFNDFTFKGKVVVHLRAEGEITKINLNAVDLTIDSCKLLDSTENQTVTHTMNYNAEEVHLELPVKKTGLFKIELIYEGKIKYNFNGVYQTRLIIGNEVHIGAIPHFETVDARRMYP